jgi:class 3 adenylate cyclase
METGRQATVLFADVSGSTKLYETAGDAVALDAIGRCIDTLRGATEAGGGRVIKTIGDEIMALFPAVEAAASAACSMHTLVEGLPAVGETRLAVKIGLHCGPVIQRDNDVFGDTVNLAARLVEQAGKGQIIMAEETAGMLGPMYQSFIRRLYAIQVRGKAEEVGLCELAWRTDEDKTTFLGARAPSRAAAAAPLRLKYHGQELTRRRDNDSVVIGREQGCGLTISDHMASRQHCTIERRQDKWVLKDHSTNGTYVTAEGDREILLQREELTLRKRGVIACGQPRAGTEEFVEYSCE